MLHARFLLGSFLGGDAFLQNISSHTEYTAPYPRRWQIYSYSLHRTQTAPPLQNQSVMLLTEIITVYSENHENPMGTPCGQNAKYLNEKMVRHTVNSASKV
jgi:hypothetical protein